MYYYQFHIGDYRAATAHLTNDEDLAYRRLLDMCYDTEKPIPRDLEWVSRRIRIPASVIRDVLNDMFSKNEDGTWFSPRADAEILKFNKFCEAGKRGAAKRWGIGLDSPPNAPLLPTQCAPYANQKPETINHKPKKEAKSPYVALDVSDSVWSDFLVLRKAKKAAVTETAISGIRREAEKVGLTLEQALKTCCERGWAGFKADWMLPKIAFANKFDVSSVTTPTPVNHDSALRKIEADRLKAVPMSDAIREKMNQLRKS